MHNGLMKSRIVGVGGWEEQADTLEKWKLRNGVMGSEVMVAA